MDTSSLRYIPNGITVLRLILVLPIAFSIVEQNYIAAFLLFAISGFSDGLDGFIARRYGWVSAFGRLIDPLADKLMMMTTTLRRKMRMVLQKNYHPSKVHLVKPKSTVFYFCLEVKRSDRSFFFLKA